MTRSLQRHPSSCNPTIIQNAFTISHGGIWIQTLGNTVSAAQGFDPRRQRCLFFVVNAKYSLQFSFFIYIVVALARLGATFIEFGAALKVFSTEYVFGAHGKTDRQTDALIAMMSRVTKKSRLPRTATAAHGLR